MHDTRRIWYSCSLWVYELWLLVLPSYGFIKVKCKTSSYAKSPKQKGEVTELPSWLSISMLCDLMHIMFSLDFCFPHLESENTEPDCSIWFFLPLQFFSYTLVRRKHLCSLKAGALVVIPTLGLICQEYTTCYISSLPVTCPFSMLASVEVRNRNWMEVLFSKPFS